MALDVPMSFRGTKETSLLLGTFPGSWTVPDLAEAAAAAAPDHPAIDLTVLSCGKDYTYAAVICLREEAQAVEEALRGIGFARPSQLTDKTPAEASRELLDQRNAEKKKISDTEAALAGFGVRRREFEILSDYYRIRADKYETLGKLPQSSRAFLISGYVPEEKSDRLAKDLLDHYGAAVEIEALPEEEDAPVLLKNGKIGGMTEGILKSFGLPGKGEIDPSFFTTVFYIFFFGLMLSGCGLRPHHLRRLWLGAAKVPADGRKYEAEPPALLLVRHFHHLLGPHVRRHLRGRRQRGDPDLLRP